MEIVPAIRAGQGPALLEVMTYRWQEHVGPNTDYQLGYRSADEAQPWIESDQLQRLAELVPAERRTRIEHDVELEIADALVFAEDSPFPAAAELHTDVFQEV